MQLVGVTSHIFSFLPLIKCLLSSHHVPGGALGTKEMNQSDPDPQGALGLTICWLKFNKKSKRAPVLGLIFLNKLTIL